MLGAGNPKVSKRQSFPKKDLTCLWTRGEKLIEQTSAMIKYTSNARRAEGELSYLPSQEARGTSPSPKRSLIYLFSKRKDWE